MTKQLYNKPRPPLPGLLRRPPRRPQSDDPDHEDQTYVLEITVVDTLGEPLAGVEVSVVNNNTGIVTSRYSDGNGYTNHGLVGRADDLCTYQTNGYKIASSTLPSTAGPLYVYLPVDPHVAAQLSLASFKRGLVPSPPVARGPLPPFAQPINYRTTLPWTPPHERDFCRGDAWGVVMPNAPWVPGASTRHPERILSWFLDRYTLDFQKEYLALYAGYGYTHLKLSLADSMGKIDNGPHSPPGNGRTLQQFIETCQLAKQYVPYVQIMLGSKYFADFEGRAGHCPNFMTTQQWADWSDPLIDALVKAQCMDECILGWEWNLWNTPGETTINAFKHAGQRCHQAGVSFWMHFGPHVTSWFADGDPRGRFGFYDDIAPDVNGINYQTMGTGWDNKEMQDRVVDTLWQFGERGNDVKLRFDEDYATFMWDNDKPDSDDANQRCYLACCTIDDVKRTDAKVWGYMNGGRRPDGSRL